MTKSLDFVKECHHMLISVARAQIVSRHPECYHMDTLQQSRQLLAEAGYPKDLKKVLAEIEKRANHTSEQGL